MLNATINNIFVYTCDGTYMWRRTKKQVEPTVVLPRQRQGSYIDEQSFINGISFALG